MHLTYQDAVNQTNLDLIHRIEKVILPNWDEESRREFHQRIQAIWEHPEYTPIFDAVKSRPEDWVEPTYPWIAYSFLAVTVHGADALPSRVKVSVSVKPRAEIHIPIDETSTEKRSKEEHNIIETLQTHFENFKLDRQESPMRLMRSTLDMVRHLKMRQYQLGIAGMRMSENHCREAILHYHAPSVIYSVYVSFAF